MLFFFLFFKQKTAYEMRISDWSSDVCSSDLLISRAASAERCASARTSWATTAKPRPLSPARAASMPALRASRLVWKAISSITPMICPIFSAERSEEHTSELQSLMRISYAVFCLKKKKKPQYDRNDTQK